MGKKFRKSVREKKKILKISYFFFSYFRTYIKFAALATIHIWNFKKGHKKTTHPNKKKKKEKRNRKKKRNNFSFKPTGLSCVLEGTTI